MGWRGLGFEARGGAVALGEVCDRNVHGNLLIAV